jgi:hypothetical protein
MEESAADEARLRTWVDSRRAYFVRRAKDEVSDNASHERVIGHFATVYESLRLANRYKLLGEIPKGFALQPLLSCLKDHLALTDPSRIEITTPTPLSLLKSYVHTNWAKLVLIDDARKSTKAPKTVPGYLYELAGRKWVGLDNSVVERIVGGRPALATLRRELNARGMLRKAAGGKAGDRFVTKVRLGEARIYLFSVDTKLFENP